MFVSPTVIMRNVSAPGPGVLARDADYKKVDLRRQDVLLEVSATTGKPVFSLQPQQSLDAITWYPVGDPITATGLTVLTVQAPAFQVTLLSISGGAITVTAA